jgi:hypothetical protein
LRINGDSGVLRFRKFTNGETEIGDSFWSYEYKMCAVVKKAICGDRKIGVAINISVPYVVRDGNGT